MKKKYLTYAGIAAAVILVIMFISILATGSFTIFPVATIDPVPDHASGDLVVITGTTNYPAGTRLVLDILTAAPATGTNPRAGGTDAFIVRGTGMTNTWSGALDTTTISPGEYVVNAYWVDESNPLDHTRSSLLATSRLRLTNTTVVQGKLTQPLVNHTLTFINLDIPGTIYRGEKILVSGTTNLPAGTELLYLIIQQSNASVITVDPKTGERDLKGGYTRSGLVDVMPGENGVNRWSVAYDSTEAIPSEYRVLVTLSNISVENLGREGPFGSESMVILEADADLLTPAVPDTGPCQSITIDDIPDRVSGRDLTITGMTRLQPGTELLFQVLPVEFEVGMNPKTGNVSGTITGAMGSVKVILGPGRNNTWSVEIDPSRLPPGNYLVNVSNDRIDSRTYETRYGNAYCSRRITITGGAV